MLADIQFRGQPRKVMLWANRNGLMYVLDRVDRRVPARQAVREGELDGRLRRTRAGRSAFPARCRRRRARSSSRTCTARPTGQPPSFSPRTGSVYVAHWENTARSSVEGRVPARRGHQHRAQTTMGQINLQNFFNNDDEAYGVVRAYDPNTLEPKWEYKMNDITWAGVLTTAE